MNLTDRQRCLLKLLVDHRDEGEFTYAATIRGSHLFFANCAPVDVPNETIDFDFEQLKDAHMVTLDRSGPYLKGRVTQNGIDAVATHFRSYAMKAQRRMDLGLASAHSAARAARSSKELLPPSTQPDLQKPRPIEPPRLRTPGTKPVVFIGHGRSLVWKGLAIHLHELNIQPCEFDSSPVAGHLTAMRLQELLDTAEFAVLVATAEVSYADGTMHARENVVHEAGLFQAKLTFARAIILLEDTCEPFSNIHGLTYIQFRKDRIEDTFHDLDRTLKREGLL